MWLMVLPPKWKNNIDKRNSTSMSPLILQISFFFFRLCCSWLSTGSHHGRLTLGLDRWSVESCVTFRWFPNRIAQKSHWRISKNQRSSKIRGKKSYSPSGVPDYLFPFLEEMFHIYYFLLQISKVYKAIKGHKRTAAKESFRIKGCLKIEERKVIVIDCYFYAQVTIAQAHSSELRVLCLITLPHFSTKSLKKSKLLQLTILLFHKIISSSINVLFLKSVL